MIVMIQEQSVPTIEYSTSNGAPPVVSFGKTRVHVIEHLPDVGTPIPALITDMIQRAAGATSSQLTA